MSFQVGSTILDACVLSVLRKKDTYGYQLNQEIKEIYTNIFSDWFTVFQNERRSNFINSLLAEDTDNALEILSDVLEASISYYDNYESFYHGFLIGFLQGSEYMIQSNKESGDGRFDIAGKDSPCFRNTDVKRIRTLRSK